MLTQGFMPLTTKKREKKRFFWKLFYARPEQRPDKKDFPAKKAEQILMYVKCGSLNFKHESCEISSSQKFALTLKKRDNIAVALSTFSISFSIGYTIHWCSAWIFFPFCINRSCTFCASARAKVGQKKTRDKCSLSSCLRFHFAMFIRGAMQLKLTQF